MKLHVIRQQEQEQLRIRHRTEQVYADLLELATLGETVSVWDTADFQAYRSRREAVCRSLRLLNIIRIIMKMVQLFIFGNLHLFCLKKMYMLILCIMILFINMILTLLKEGLL